MNRIAPYALFLVLTACADDEASPELAAPVGQPLCEAGTLEPDIVDLDENGDPVATAWMGPGVDPDTGELMGDGPYVVSSTYLRLQSGLEAGNRFGELMGPIIQQLNAAPGLVAMQLGQSGECGTARTLTVWEDMESMMEFVVSDAHGDAVRAVGEVSRGGSVVTHWEAAPDAIDWKTAASRVAADDGPFY